MKRAQKFVSRSHEQVEETWRQYVPSAVLRKVDPGTFRFDWFSVELPGLNIVSYELAAQVQSDVEPDNQILVCRVNAPSVQLSTAKATVDPGRPWITDGQFVRARWEETARVNALIFQREAAEALARQLLGDDSLRLRFDGITPETTARSSHWEHTFDYLVKSSSALGEGDDILASGLQRQALWTTLTAFPTSFREALERPSQRRGASATVRRAMNYIDDNAHLPITVDDVAAAAYMSTRGLQYAFRRELDITPADALRRARLEGARREIREGTGEPIAAIARRWGFAHPSRFAAAYRAAYRLSPSEDARRHK